MVGVKERIGAEEGVDSTKGVVVAEGQVVGSTLRKGRSIVVQVAHLHHNPQHLEEAGRPNGHIQIQLTYHLLPTDLKALPIHHSHRVYHPVFFVYTEREIMFHIIIRIMSLRLIIFILLIVFLDVIRVIRKSFFQNRQFRLDFCWRFFFILNLLIGVISFFAAYAFLGGIACHIMSPMVTFEVARGRLGELKVQKLNHLGLVTLRQSCHVGDITYFGVVVDALVKFNSKNRVLLFFLFVPTVCFVAFFNGPRIAIYKALCGFKSFAEIKFNVCVVGVV